MNNQKNPSKAGATVAYAPTQANRLVLSKIRALPMLDGIAFSPLPDNRPERIGLLQNILQRENVLFLWGDGQHHDESYHFTARPATEGMRRLKVNLDPHSDEYTCLGGGDGFDFETMKPKRGNLRLMTFANHMSCTEADGVRIFTSERMNNGGLVSAIMREFTDVLLQKITNQGMMRFVKTASMKAISFAGEVDLTLDLDLVRGMPVMEKFMQKLDSVNAARLLSVLEGIFPSIALFDTGGFVDAFPNFTLIEDIPLGKPPKEADVLTFISASKDGELAKMNQGVIDTVGSYSAMFLANVIRVFFESRE
ncbi:MAG: hypothetical protein ABII71_03515 [Candidatus Micrarchaeota archaeon]